MDNNNLPELQFNTFDPSLNMCLELVERDVMPKPFIIWVAIPTGIIMGEVISNKKYLQREIDLVPESPGDKSHQIGSAFKKWNSVGIEIPEKRPRIIIEQPIAQIGGQTMHSKNGYAFVDPGLISAWGETYLHLLGENTREDSPR